MLGGLGVLAHAALHGSVAPQEHLVGYRAVQGDGGGDAAHHAVAAGADAGGGDAGPDGVNHRPVKGVDAVQHLQLRGQGAGVVTAVIPDAAHALLADADVAVGVDHARGDIFPGGVKDLLALGGLELRSNLLDFPILHADVPQDEAALLKQQHITMLYDHVQIPFLTFGG